MNTKRIDTPYQLRNRRDTANGIPGGATSQSVQSGGSWLEQYFTFDAEKGCLIVNQNFASTKGLGAYADDGNLPPTIWESIPVGSGLINDNGVLKVDGDVGTGFDESANYNPSGDWNFTGLLEKGGAAVATESWASGQFESKFTKKTAFNKNFAGTGSATTVARSDHNHNSQYHPLGGSSITNFVVQDLVIHGTVNHWLGDVITVDDARLQLNRTQDAATVASGIDIYNGSSVVSSLLYGTDNRWKIGGQNIATESWVQNTAKAADSNLLDGIDSSIFLTGIGRTLSIYNFSDTINSSAIPVGFSRIYTDNNSPVSWAHGFTLKAGSSRGFQLLVEDSGNNIYLRNQSGDGTGWDNLATIWHSRNDGAGSGLDADKLDGLHSSQFLRSDTADEMNALLTNTAGISIESDSWAPYSITRSGTSSYWGVSGDRVLLNSTHKLFLRIGGVDALNIIESGNVGINTTSPAEALDVNGNGKFSGNLTLQGIYAEGLLSNVVTPTDNSRFDGYGIIGNRSSFYVTNSGGDVRFCTGGPHGSGVRAAINFNGLSVGKVGASEALDVNGNILASGEVTAYSHVNTRDRFRIYDSNGNLKWSIGYDSTNDDMIFYNASGTKAAALTQGGDFKATGGIGCYQTLS